MNTTPAATPMLLHCSRCGQSTPVSAEQKGELVACPRCGDPLDPARLAPVGGSGKPSLVKEFFLFIRQEKKWWLIPLVIVLLIVGALILFASSSPLAPFVYPLF